MPTCVYTFKYMCIWELPFRLAKGIGRGRVADLRPGHKGARLKWGLPGEGHPFQSGVLMVTLGPPVGEARAPLGRSGDSVLVSVPRRQAVFNKG